MIDLHMHSTYSDGTNSLDELIEKLKEKNINCFALTDHDTAAGCREILSNQSLKFKLNNYKIRFISGAEWTSIYNGHKMHILAYDFNPFDEKILNLEKRMRHMLDEKDRLREVELEKRGFVLSEKSKNYLSTKQNVRSMDYAKCLVDDGYYEELEQAFKLCLNTIKYPFECRYDAVELLKILKSCGAKVVWAHSIYDVKRKITPFEEVERIISELKPFGLDGLECYYSLYNKEEIERLQDIAKKYGLCVTCGSDYHGENKEVKLGQFSSDEISVNDEEVSILKLINDNGNN